MVYCCRRTSRIHVHVVLNVLVRRHPAPLFGSSCLQRNVHSEDARPRVSFGMFVPRTMFYRRPILDYFGCKRQRYRAIPFRRPQKKRFVGHAYIARPFYFASKFHTRELRKISQTLEGPCFTPVFGGYSETEP
jgi:hypothetical protein